MEIFLEEKENRAGSAGRTVAEDIVRVEGTGVILGRGGAVSGAGRVGCLLTTDKLRCFHW